MGISGGPDIIQNGLILALDAADKNSYPGSGTTWKDLSENNNNGTLTNGPTFNTDNGGNIVMDNTDDFIEVPHNSLLNFPTAITIHCWVKTTISTNAYIATKNEDSFFFAIGPSGTTAGKASIFYNGAPGWLQSTTTVSTGNWVNITATWNGSLSTIYVNGISEASASRAGTMSSGTTPLYIGKRNVASLLGSIGNISFYNRSLSASEVLQNYNATKTRFGL